MMKTKILVAGIGGVGGYFGGLLAKYYAEDSSVSINFLARGANLAAIRKNGLRVNHDTIQFFATPDTVSDHPMEIGPVDLILICTKSYDLEELLRSLKPCINDHTILLPLLNGIDHRKTILNYYPHQLVLDGFVYIVSRLKEPGMVENYGNVQKLFFGLDGCEDSRLIFYEKIFLQAGIDAHYVSNILPLLWEKYIFLSPIATATCYYDQCIGALLAEEKSMSAIQTLIEEVILLAKANNINVAEDLPERTIQKLKSLPFETTSSLHHDVLQRKSKTELQTLTAYVILEAKKHQIETPFYKKLYAHLSTNYDCD